MRKNEGEVKSVRNVVAKGIKAIFSCFLCFRRVKMKAKKLRV